MSSSSDNESYDSDGSSAIHNESSVDGDFGEDDVIRMGEMNLVKLNRPDKKRFLIDSGPGNTFIRENWTERHWVMMGRLISGNHYLREIEISSPDDTGSAANGALNDQNMKSFFQGLTRSNSIRSMTLYSHGFGIEGLHAMIPFLKNANNLISLDVNQNEIGSEGFSLLWRTFCGSPIEKLWCGWCGVESIEIDENCTPKCLKSLNLMGGNINSDGCRELTKLLLKKDTTLNDLFIGENNIDDEGVAILVDALRKNTSLKRLSLDRNERISMKGKALMLKLVNDISSIKATLESNHTLSTFGHDFDVYGDKASDDIMRNKISAALKINRSNVREAGQAKVISTQLSSEERASLCRLQEVDICNDALYSEINPLHLPEVLEMVGCNHGHSELYVALQSTIAGLFSTINRKKRLQDRLEHHLSIIETLRTEIAAIEEAEGNLLETENESRSVGFKRPRTS